MYTYVYMYVYIYIYIYIYIYNTCSKLVFLTTISQSCIFLNWLSGGAERRALGAPPAPDDELPVSM